MQNTQQKIREGAIPLINDLPDFDVKPESVVPEMEAILKQARAVLAEATKGS